MIDNKYCHALIHGKGTVMSMINLPVGVSDFEKIRKDGLYYIDKTDLIAELLKDKGVKVTLLTRPRRFGKTLAMSMLSHFFDIRKDTKAIFSGLNIAERQELCREWQNQWPTLFLTFKDVDGLTFESAREMLRIQIASLYNKHSYLASSEKVNDNDRKVFCELSDLVDGAPTDAMLKTGIAILMRMMQAHYGKSVILLLDEYDVPLAKASAHQYYAQMLEIMKAMMSTVLKDNTALCFAVITGCLKVSKESIFTGTNNFVSDSISDTRWNEYFGFTQSEVHQLLKDAGQSEKAELLRKWYDGYHFGNMDVYCPWDVMNYIRDLQADSSRQPVGYWKNTSDNAVIRSFIDTKSSTISEKLEVLVNGGYIRQKVDENLTYDYLKSSEDNLWSVLYLTGYLTRMRKSDLSEEEWQALERTGEEALRIPNKEIREIYETTIQKWFDDSAVLWDRKPLFDAVWNGDSEQLTLEMSRLLRMTISYHDYREDFYHAFLAGIFSGAGYVVESNKEHGEGRSDVIVRDSRGGRVVVFEAKYAGSVAGMEAACEQALQQIDERMYAREFEDDYDQVLCYGISFFKKRCLVRRKIST